MQSNFIFLCFVIGFNILHLESHCRNAILGLKWSQIHMTNFVKVPPFVLVKIIRFFFLKLRYMYFLFLIQGRKECSRGNHSSTSNSSNEPNGCSTDRWQWRLRKQRALSPIRNCQGRELWWLWQQLANRNYHMTSQQHEPLVLRIIVTTVNCNSYALFWISVHMYMNNQERIFFKWKLAIAYLLLPIAFSIVMYCSCEKNIFKRKKCRDILLMYYCKYVSYYSSVTMFIRSFSFQFSYWMCNKNLWFCVNNTTMNWDTVIKWLKDKWNNWCTSFGTCTSITLIVTTLTVHITCPLLCHNCHKKYMLVALCLKIHSITRIMLLCLCFPDYFIFLPDSTQWNSFFCSD